MIIENSYAERIGLELDSFLDRTDEIGLVKDTVYRLAHSQTPHEQSRHIIYRAERGVGATALANELFNQLRQEPFSGYVTPVLIHFENHHNGNLANGEYSLPFDSTHDEDDIRSILMNMSMFLGTTIAPNASIDELGGWLTRDLIQKYKTETNVLCVITDSTFETTSPWRDKIVEKILTPLAESPTTQFVTISKGHLPLLKNEQLRNNCVTKDLPPLSQNDTKTLVKQIGQTSGLTEAGIFQIGKGYPLNTRLLAQDGLVGLNTTVNELLEITSGRNPNAVRGVFEALCVLQEGWRSQEIPIMLAAYHKGKLSSTVGDLFSTHLIRWHDMGYKIDESVRTITETYLRLFQLNTFLYLHQAAHDMYANWSSTKPNGILFTARAEYHQSILNSFG